MNISTKPKKILIISPGIEDAGMRGLGKVTFSLIDALHSIGYTTYLLTGAPIKHKKSIDLVDKITLKRYLSHYLSEGIKSEAFRLVFFKSLNLFFIDLFNTLLKKGNVISNKNELPAQHEPISLRQFKNVDYFVNFSLIYKALNKLPLGLRSYIIYKIAYIIKANAIITASPYPIKKPWFFRNKIKIIQSLHDVMPLNILETPPDSVLIFGKSFKISMSNADLILTSSENAKNKLLTIYSNAKVSVIYVPCKEADSPNLINKKFTKIYNKIGGKYILFMSALEKRKNVARLIEAFDLLNNKHGYKLILVGSPGYGYHEIENTYSKTSDITKKNIIFKGYVSEDEKWALIKNATFIIHPAIDEGLGIPPIEAMIAKKPVVATRLNSLEEFLPAESIVYIEDPYNATDIADKILYAIDNIKALKQNSKVNSKRVVRMFSDNEFENRLESALESIELKPY